RESWIKGLGNVRSASSPVGAFRTLKGEKGERGAKGPPGDSIRGPPGPPGPKGEPGTSAPFFDFNSNPEAKYALSGRLTRSYGPVLVMSIIIDPKESQSKLYRWGRRAYKRQLRPVVNPTSSA
ncbi:hypothetical protein GQX74_004548, partial [Glossina fuscipes]